MSRPGPAPLQPVAGRRPPVRKLLSGAVPMRGAALLSTVLLVSLAATMSAVVVRQSLSLARSESERLSAVQATSCVQELRATTEAALMSDPDIPVDATPEAAGMFEGARAVTSDGRVIAAGLTGDDVSVGCVDGFNSADHRVVFDLPSVARPTLQVVYAARSGQVAEGVAVEYSLDSVSGFQVWSEERLDLSRLHTFGEARDDSAGSGTQPSASGGPGGAAGVVGVVTPETSSPVGSTLAPVDGMTISFTAPGGRRYRITSVLQPRSDVAGEVLQQQLVRNGVAIQAGMVALPNQTNPVSHELVAIDVPSAGQVTYQVRARFAAGTGVSFRSSAFRPYLLVEDVGPADISAEDRVLPSASAGGLVAVAPDLYRPGAPFALTFGQLWQMPQLPDVGVAEAGDDAGVPRTLSASFDAVAGRAYRLVSLVHPYAPSVPGAVVEHRMLLDDGDGADPVRSALVPLPNSSNAFSHLLETVWTAPEGFSGEVTVQTALGYSGGPGAVYNYVGSGFNPFVAVFDLGPVGLVSSGQPAGAQPAGLIGLVGPDGFAASPGGQLAELTFTAAGDRMVRTVASVHAASDVPSDAGFLRLSRGLSAVQQALVAPVNLTLPAEHRVSSVELPSAGEVSYGLSLSFSSGGGSLSSSGAASPVLFVEDLGRIGVLTFGDGSELSGAVYGAEGVSVFFGPEGGLRSLPNVALGRDAATEGASPRHLQVLSPQRDPGSSLSPNIAVYTDDPLAGRLPGQAGRGAPGRISGRGRTVDAAARSSGGSVAGGVDDQMRLDLPHLVAGVSDRVDLACGEGGMSGAICVSAGQLVGSGTSAASRPAGVVGYASPSVGEEAEVPRGGAPALIPGQSVSFVADGTRMYRITSVLRTASGLPGDMVDHRIVRNGVSVQAGLFPFEGTGQVVPSTLVRFDIPAAGPVTYQSAARLAADPAGLEPAGRNVTLNEGTTFLLVEDVGPAGGAVPPPDGAGGLVGVSAPAGPVTGVFAPGQLVQVPGQEVSFDAPGGRRYELVSTVMPVSQAPGDVVRHLLGRVGASLEVLAEEELPLANTSSLRAGQLLAFDAPPAGAVVYRSYLQFALGLAAANSNWVALPSHSPSLVVLDAGPQVLPETLSEFPAGLVATGSASGPASVQVDARAARMYRIDAEVEVSSEAVGDAARVSLWRTVTVDGVPSEVAVQQAQVVLDASGVPRTVRLSALDVASASGDRQVSYEVRSVFAREVAVPGSGEVVSSKVTVADVGLAAAPSGSPDGQFRLTGTGSWAPQVPRSAGLLRAGYGPLSLSLSDVPVVVAGQQVSFESDGNRRYRVTSVLHPSSTSSSEMLLHEVVRSVEGSDASAVQSLMTPVDAADLPVLSQTVVYDTPSPGRVTYSTRASFAVEGSVSSVGAQRGFLLVEDMGPVLGGEVPAEGPAGLLGDVAYGLAGQRLSEDVPAAVSGQQATVVVQPGRRYTVTSSVQPFSWSDVPGEQAFAVFHRLFRISGGQELLLSEALVPLANAVNPAGHVLEVVDVPDVSGQVSYRTVLEFVGGDGGNLVAEGFRPFVAVADAGAVAPPEAGTFPRGVISYASPASAGQVTVDDGVQTVDVLDVQLSLPAGRLYRLSSHVMPSFVDDGDLDDPVSYVHQLLRSDGAGGFTLVHEAGGMLLEVGTTTGPGGSGDPLPAVSTSHLLTAVDAPVAGPAEVTYRVRLLFPDGGTVGVSADGPDGLLLPHLTVEDVGPAREASDVFGFGPDRTLSSLSGSASALLSSRIPDDALSFKVRAVPDGDDEAASLFVEACPSRVCDGQVTSSFVLELGDAGLVVFDGHVSLSGTVARPLTLIAGSPARPAGLVVDVSTVMLAPVQLVASDRLTLNVSAPDVEGMLEADLVALGLGSDVAVPLDATGTWSSMQTVRGSVAAPSVDIVTAFGASGPLRLTPRVWPRQAPWAVGFSSDWTSAGSRDLSAGELAVVFGS